MYKLEQWSVSISNPYLPPEAQSSHLSGKVYGHPRFDDGYEITTSAIVKTEKRVVTTKTGSMYELGEPDPQYVEWCRKQGCHVPSEEEPIKIHERKDD